MRKHEVASAAVDVERAAEELLGHRGALDVPTGPPASPRRIPPRVFALFVRLPEHDRQLVIADIPGLIEGASAGAGLGHEFLAHIERTRLLVHVLDLAPVDESDPRVNFETVEGELRGHGAGLARLPRILCLSKADLVPEAEAEAARAEWADRLSGAVLDVV